MQYHRSDRSALIRSFQGQNLPEIALAVSNDDRSIQAKIADLPQIIDQMTGGDLKNLARANAVYFIRNQETLHLMEVSWTPDRRKAPRNPGRHGFDRLAISEQHRNALEAVAAPRGVK